VVSNPYESPLATDDDAQRQLEPRFRRPVAISAAIAAIGLSLACILPAEGSWKPLDSVSGYAVRGEHIGGIDVIITDLAPYLVGLVLFVSVLAHRRWALVNVITAVYAAVWFSGLIVYVLRVSGLFGLDVPAISALLSSVVVALTLFAITAFGCRYDSGLVFFIYVFLLPCFSLVSQVGAVFYAVLEDGLMPRYGIAVGMTCAVAFIGIVGVEFREARQISHTVQG
jgi:hypothetical protein